MKKLYIYNQVGGQQQKMNVFRRLNPSCSSRRDMSWMADSGQVVEGIVFGSRRYLRRLEPKVL
jgi:hypothetical protein